MIKWIKNSKGAVNNKTTGYKGITISHGKYKASVNIRLSVGKGKPKETKTIHIGEYKTLVEAKKERIKFILNLL
tara:strand:+ start:2054 stop:2275 length:222 start_codon:yes stop_codon:yes gene_type:complete